MPLFPPENWGAVECQGGCQGGARAGMGVQSKSKSKSKSKSRAGTGVQNQSSQPGLDSRYRLFVPQILVRGR